MQRNTRRVRTGFTLIELVVVLAILGLIMLFGFPALQNMIARSRLEGTAREVGVIMQQARFAAIKNNTRVAVRADTDIGLISAFRDREDPPSPVEGTQDGGELTVGPEGGFPLPNGLLLVGPPGDALGVSGFPTSGNHGWVTFLADGSVKQEGAFRIADRRGNYLELRVEPRATARVQMRKWDAATSAWRTQGEKGAWTYQ